LLFNFILSQKKKGFSHRFYKVIFLNPLIGDFIPNWRTELGYLTHITIEYIIKQILNPFIFFATIYLRIIVILEEHKTCLFGPE